MKTKLHGQAGPAAHRNLTPTGALVLQRKCAWGASSAMSGDCEECNGKRLSLQRSAVSESKPGVGVPPIVNEVLREPGQPLDADTRVFMESGFAHDFSKVRVHSDAKASASARAINALAYTVGPRIAVRSDKYAPTTDAGRRLLAHELAHVVQQSGGVDAGEPESRADLAAQRIMSGQSIDPGAVGAAPAGLYLQSDEAQDENETPTVFASWEDLDKLGLSFLYAKRRQPLVSDPVLGRRHRERNILPGIPATSPLFGQDSPGGLTMRAPQSYPPAGQGWKKPPIGLPKSELKREASKGTKSLDLSPDAEKQAFATKYNEEVATTGKAPTTWGMVDKPQLARALLDIVTSKYPEAVEGVMSLFEKKPGAPDKKLKIYPIVGLDEFGLKIKIRLGSVKKNEPRSVLNDQ